MALDLGPLAKVNFRTPPKPVRVVVIVLPIIIVAALLVFVVFLPKKKQMDKLKLEIVELEKKIKKAQSIADKLEEVEREYKRMERELCELEKVVPPEYEVSSFLKQVNAYSIEREISVVTWKEGAPRQYPQGIVNENPISLTLEGVYHRIGEFLADFTTFDRVITVANLKMGAAGKSKDKSGTNKLKVTMTAVAYTSIQPVKCEDDKPAGGRK
jgi:type IV pilus assembly protein PilO